MPTPNHDPLPSRQPRRRMLTAGLAGLFCALALTGLAGAQETAETPGTGPQSQLGPRDGRDLPPTELDRVQVGLPAPDFSLRSIAGDVVTLSDFRGKKNVVLVFYRGHW